MKLGRPFVLVRLLTVLILCLWPSVGLAQQPTPSGAMGAPGPSWLDQTPIAAWNTPGTGVPRAPAPGNAMSPDDPFYEQCRASHRPAETPEDALVEQAGWTLFQTYEAGWGAKVIYGLSGHDGMCRPMGYQVFVFVNGAFAGTISPAPMDSRTDGGLAGSVELHLPREPGLTARFARYSQQDPLCCPSRLTTLDLKIEQQAGGAVLVPAGQPVTTPTES